MRSGRLSVVFLIAACCSSCFEGNRKAEQLISKSVTQFHQQLKEEHYHEIYSQADTELQNHIGEAAFIAQRAGEHRHLGMITSKPYVSIKDSFWQEIRKTFGSH